MGNNITRDASGGVQKQSKRQSLGRGIFSSLQGRIALFAISSCVALVLGASAVFVLMRQASVPAIENIKARQQTQTDLNSLRFYIERTESGLLRYLITPDNTVRKEIYFLLDSYQAGLQRLRASQWVQASPALRARLAEQAGDRDRLQEQITSLLDLRDDNRKLFPPMPIMLNDMLPANQKFYTAATLAMSALDDDTVKGNASARTQYREFSQVRHSWSQMIGAFRLYVTNRLGIFGDPVKSAKASLTNIDIYLQQVEQSLRRIRAWQDDGQLTLETDAAINDMAVAHTDWLEAFNVVVKKFSGDDWRMDLTVLKSNVDPEFRAIGEKLDRLAADLDASTINDINVLTSTGQQVALYLIVFAILGVLVSIMFYLVFRHSVLSPIRQVASALREEADVAARPDQSLAPSPKLPVPTTTEARDLVSAFKDMREQVWIRQQRLATILDHAAEGIITFDDNGKIQTFNGAAERLFACSESDVIDTKIEELIPPKHILVDGDTPQTETGQALYMGLIGKDVEAAGQRRDGSIVNIALKLTTMVVRGQRIFTGLVEDISDRKAMLDNLRNLAERDALTGLLNRAEFEQRLRQVLESAQQNGPESTLLYMDLDQFKVLNDTCGHVAGDESLRQLSTILQEQVRTGDVLARLGGDEFAVILESCPLHKGIQVAEKIRESVRDHRFAWKSNTGMLSVSIGVVAINAASKNMVDVLNAADRACYAAKDGGRNKVYVYRESDADLARRRSEMVWVSRINAALENERFYLVAQPIMPVDMSRPDQHGFWELLLRMVDEEGRVIEPGAYLPAAERFDLLDVLDKWVVNRTLSWLAEAQDRLRGDEVFAVNISGHSLGNSEFATFVLEQLDRTGVAARNICFEITETAAVTHFQQATNFIDTLKKHGAQFALDDFGSGLSSFGFLKNIQVDYLKIDGTFIQDIAQDPIDRHMVRAINDVGHLMGMQTVAEWVESDAVIARLRALGVDMMQGDAVGTPVPLVDLPLPAKTAVSATS